jgi:hypothetical protein
MDPLERKDSSDTFVGVTSNAVKRHFWGSCGKDGCNFGPTNNNQRVDPVLKLYPNCPLMFTMNADVPNGQANGSHVFLQHIDVKPGEYPIHILLENGVTIRAFFVSQIATLKLQHEMDDIVPNQFDATPETFFSQQNSRLKAAKITAK